MGSGDHHIHNMQQRFNFCLPPNLRPFDHTEQEHQIDRMWREHPIGILSVCASQLGRLSTRTERVDGHVAQCAAIVRLAKKEERA